MTAPATVPEVLARAADVIEELGWHQGWFINRDTGAVCCVGAIHIAVGLPPTAEISSHANIPRYWLAVQARDRLFGYFRKSVSGWNDTPGRTQDEVVAALRAAAGAVA